MKTLIIVLFSVTMWLNNNFSVIFANEMLSLNLEALKSSPGGFPAGVCLGTGPNWTNISCPGGTVICCWAHTDVFGKDPD